MKTAAIICFVIIIITAFIVFGKVMVYGDHSEFGEFKWIVLTVFLVGIIGTGYYLFRVMLPIA